MSNKYFYLKPYYECKPSEKIPMYEIKKLALFATTLESLPETSETAGLAASLFIFFQTNQDHELAQVYRKLQSSKHGNEILCLSIELCLLEESFKEDQITPALAEKYNQILKAYQTCIDFSKLDDDFGSITEVFTR